MALFHKQRTGQGQLVDACLFRSGLYILGCPLMMSAGDRAASGDAKRSSRSIRSNRGGVFNPGFNVYKTKDGQWLQLLGLEAGRHLPRLLEVMGLGDLRKVRT